MIRVHLENHLKKLGFIDASDLGYRVFVFGKRAANHVCINISWHKEDSYDIEVYWGGEEMYNINFTITTPWQIIAATIDSIMKCEVAL